MELKARKYRLIDAVLICFSVCPFWTSVRLLSTILWGLLPAAMVVVIARLIDTAIAIATHQSQASLLGPLLMLIGMCALMGVGGTVSDFIWRRTGQAMTVAMTIAVVNKSARLKYEHVENPEVWELVSRVSGDPSGRLGELYSTMQSMVETLFSVASVFALIAAVVWWMGLAVVVFCVPAYFWAYRLGKEKYNQEKQAVKHSRYADYFAGVLSGRGDVEERTLFGYGDELQKRWARDYETARKIRFDAQRKNFIRMKMASMVLIVLSLCLTGALVFPLRQGLLTVGMFCGLVTQIYLIVQRLGWSISWSISSLTEGREYLADLTTFSQLSETPDAVVPRDDLRDFALDKIEFRDVCFAYPGTERNILAHLNLTLEAGINYAVVGVNGAGKTTLAKLLCRQYDNYTGEILINGRELREYPMAWIKGFFGVVFQDFARYSISLRDNLTIGCLVPPAEEDLYDLIDKLGMRAWVDELPRGLDTPLGKILEKGHDLSGGQWQRVAIARCLAAPACLRILDEPTAALDPVSESEVYWLFHDISRGRSSIVITHRLGAARMADCILVLDGGAVAEQGNHDQLLEKGGIYASFFNSQRSWYHDEV